MLSYTQTQRIIRLEFQMPYYLKKMNFLQKKGFRGNLKFVRGEFDFIVNKYARKGSQL